VLLLALRQGIIPQEKFGELGRALKLRYLPCDCAERVTREQHGIRRDDDMRAADRQQPVIPVKRAEDSRRETIGRHQLLTGQVRPALRICDR